MDAFVVIAGDDDTQNYESCGERGDGLPGILYHISTLHMYVMAVFSHLSGETATLFPDTVCLNIRTFY